MKCVDCGTEHDRRDLQMCPVVVDQPDGGYEEIPMPLCHRCRGKRHGYNCPQCGITHDTKRDAEFCCERAPGEAPDCPECGRRMKRTAHGMTADGQPTCEFAECESCGIQWGKFTGWHDPEDTTENISE